MIVRADMVTVFVVRPDATGTSHEFLQLLRSDERYLGRTWQTVRGGIEAGETADRAALRELCEETSLVPREFYRLGTAESFYIADGDTLWHSAPFCAVVARDQAVTLNEEHDDFRWIPRDRIDSQTMWASERALLPGLLRDILDDGPGKALLRLPVGESDGRR
jgi:dATP pyrophosphohydrolase